MSVYRQGERRDEPEQEKNPLDKMGQEIEKTFDKMGKAFNGLFTSKEKKWEKKGSGHTLGDASSAGGSSASHAAASRQAPVPVAPRVQDPAAARRANALADAAAARAAGGGRPKPAAGGQAPARPAAAARPEPARPPVGRSTAEPSAEALALLAEMGFAPSDARAALLACGGNAEEAIEMLSTSQVPAQPAPPVQTVQPAPAAPAAPPAQPASPARAGADEAEMELRIATLMSMLGSATNSPTEPAGAEAAVDRACADLGRSAGYEAAAPLALLARLLSNIAANPTDPKFRRVRLTNPKIGGVLGAHPDACAALAGCGWRICDDGEHAEMDAQMAMDGHAVGACLEIVQRAMKGADEAALGPCDAKARDAPHPTRACVRPRAGPPPI